MEIPKPDLRALLLTHQDKLFRFILKHVGDRTEAEDLTQQTFLEVVRCYQHFRNESSPTTWMYGIALNLVRNHFKRSPQRRYQHVGDEVLLATPSGDDPGQELERRRQMLGLQAAIRDLAPDLREVLVLVTLEGMAYDEAASLLGIPVGTVRSRLSRARDQVRRKIGGTVGTPSVTKSVATA